jgi:hypothetical protein
VIGPNGGTFTYNFTVNDQYGSYWYVTPSRSSTVSKAPHGFVQEALSRTGGTHIMPTLWRMALSEGSFIHSPDDPLKLGQDFDEERVLYVSDWM